MDGLTLLKHVREHFDMPIVIMSAEQKTELAVDCLNLGACFYLDKPVDCSVLATIWQHAVITRRPNVRSSTHEVREMQVVLGQPSSSTSVTGDLNDELGKERTPPAAGISSPTEVLPPQDADDEELRQVVLQVEEAMREANIEDGHDSEMADDHNSAAAADEEDDGHDQLQEETNVNDIGGSDEANCEADDAHNDDDDDEDKEKKETKKQKKPRVVWTGELHQLFLEAIDRLGIDKACPRKILELMNRPELTRAHVASHLQKYRQYLRRKAEGNRPDGNGRTSRFPPSRRKSVFDTVPSRPSTANLITNQIKDMQIYRAPPAPPAAPYIIPTLQSTLHSFTSSSSAAAPSSSAIAAAYKGFSLAPPQHYYSQPLQQNQLGLGKSTTILFDSRPRSTTNFFSFQSGQGSFSGTPSTSYGQHYPSGQSSATPRQHATTSTVPAFNMTMQNMAGNFEAAAGCLTTVSSSLLGNASNNNSNNILAGSSSSSTFPTRTNSVVDMAGIGLQQYSSQPAANAMGYTYTASTTNYVGLQIEPTTGQLGFGQNSSICSNNTDLFPLDVASEPNAGIDNFDFLDQFIQGDLQNAVSDDHKRRVVLVDNNINNTGKSLAGVEASTAKQLDSSISLGQNDSSTITSNGCTSNNILIPADHQVAINPPPEHGYKEQQNRVPLNDFSGLGFDLGEDVTFENFTSLLFDQEHDGHTAAERNITNNFAGAGDDKQREDQPDGTLTL